MFFVRRFVFCVLFCICVLCLVLCVFVLRASPCVAVPAFVHFALFFCFGFVCFFIHFDLVPSLHTMDLLCLLILSSLNVHGEGYGGF